MSNLVNDDEHRARFHASCARHVSAEGCVLIERHPPDWQPEAGLGGKLGDVAISLEEVRVDGPVIVATVRDDVDGRSWRRPFRARILDDAEIGAELERVGLRLVRTLDERDTWVEARPSVPRGEAKLA